jgi:ABC-2 type transport system ATP-binding protein
LYGIPKSQECERIESSLKLVGLWEKRKVITKTFSGGMKRRLEIARGLLHHPKILFLDEPTLGLDPQTRNSIWEYIKDVNKKEDMTVFFTTHYMDEAERVSDRIAIIDHGKIVEIGSSDELKKKTNTDSLEDAFLKLTGKSIRDENSNHLDHMRNRRRIHGRGRR